MHQDDQESNTHPPDPGNLADLLHEDVRVHTDHRALDGTPHVLPESLERFEADQRHRDEQAAIDEDSQPESEVGA